MKPRFQADADLNSDIVSGIRIRESRINFQTAEEAGLEGIPDPVVLALAASEGRILVTHDRRTMPVHFGAFISAAISPGVIVISQNLGVREAIEELLLIWEASDAEDWLNQLVSIPL